MRPLLSILGSLNTYKEISKVIGEDIYYEYYLLHVSRVRITFNHVYTPPGSSLTTFHLKYIVKILRVE
jgi:hypothetical protein